MPPRKLVDLFRTGPCRRGRSRLAVYGAVLSLALANIAHATDAGTQETCAALKSLSSPTFQVEAAEWVAATRLPSGPAGATVEVPDHCLFRVVIEPRPSGIEDLRYGTGIELRLPAKWNGRFLFQGGGGLNGVLNPAIGAVAGFPPALARGFAVVSTDSGHRGRSAVDVRFGVDQQARLDFAYQAVERTTHEAKSLLTRYYGRKPDYSYYMGCSTGGREAMLAAQRLPLEFNGVVAGNPSYNLTRVVVNQVWNLQAVTRLAPKDANGKPVLYEAFTDAQLKRAQQAILQECDALDGLRDGMINDFQACHFDPERLVCHPSGDEAAEHCLSTAQAQALKAIFGGARNSRGEPLRFDFDRDITRTTETAAINDAVATLHSTFSGRGGKMIVYHGLSDQAMSTGVLTGWYEHLSPHDAEGPQSWARLFLVPGMTHCGGGQSTDQFDMLSAIQAWVEQGQVPDRIVASGRTFPNATRPLCPYPKVARYEAGDVEDQRSFTCR